jgi:predicted ester cyclase
VNTGNLERVAEFIAPADAEGAKEHIGALRKTYPDLHVTVDTQIAEGDLVATCIVARDTHRGKFWGIEPTNKPIRIGAVNMIKLKTEKL